MLLSVVDAIGYVFLEADSCCFSFVRRLRLSWLLLPSFVHTVDCTSGVGPSGHGIASTSPE